MGCGSSRFGGADGSPSSPYLLRPQHQTSPDPRRAQENSPAASSSTTSPRWGTAAAATINGPPATAAWPEPLRPQQATVRSRRRAQTCIGPAASSAQSSIPSTGTGRDEPGPLVEGLPSCPSGLAPQQNA